jgi:hypothetical protein
MKRLLAWYRDYSKRWHAAHPEYPKLRRMAARWNGLLLGFAGILYALAILGSRVETTGWPLFWAMTFCALHSAFGFGLFAWSFRMRV